MGKKQDSINALEAELFHRQQELLAECVSLRQTAHELADKLRCDRLAKMDVMDSPPEKVFDDMLELLASLSKFEGAMLTFIDHERAFIKGSTDATKLGHLPREESICNFAIQNAHEPLIIVDAAADDRFANLLPVRNGLRTYAGRAITSADGIAVGAVCLVNSKTRSVTDDEVVALERAANIISHILRYRSAPK